MDTGPNGLQNFPVLSAAATNGAGSVHFGGSLTGAATTTYRVEFFASSAADPRATARPTAISGSTTSPRAPPENAVIGVTLVAA